MIELKERYQELIGSLSAIQSVLQSVGEDKKKIVKEMNFINEQIANELIEEKAAKLKEIEMEARRTAQECATGSCE